ncbi:MAG TPA: PepSY domain-containing protein [Burkholderiales bacterium]
MTPAVRRVRTLRRWHRRIGIVAALFLLFLALSGVLINHPQAWGLDRARIHSPLLARWYGVHPPPPRTMYASAGHRLVWGSGTWLLDGHRVAEDAPPPLGMVALDNGIYIATADAVFQYGAGYALVEKISGAALPAAPIARLGALGDRLAVRAGGASFATTDGLRWQRVGGHDATWSAPEPVPEALAATLAARLVPGIPVQRLLADLHSGRIFGAGGAFIMDAAALLLAILALTGTWLFLRRW